MRYALKHLFDSDAAQETQAIIFDISAILQQEINKGVEIIAKTKISCLIIQQIVNA